KAEFLSHYYKGRLRPLSAYAMGLIHVWARLASRAPWIVNAVTHAPGLSYLVKALGGIAQNRTLPRFAECTFIDWFRARPNHTERAVVSHQLPATTRVLLWPDTFNNHFHPDAAIAATKVLESAGCEVV